MTTTNSFASGREVESAAFHAPVTGSPPADVSRRSGFRGKVDNLKHDVQRNVSGQITKLQTSMKTKPMMWAGIAAGSGLALGLLGRFIHWRNDHRRMTPDLVVIESSC